MVSSTLCPAVHILGSRNVYGRAKGIADHYWPWAVFYFFVFFFSFVFYLPFFLSTFASGPLGPPVQRLDPLFQAP